MSFRKRSLHHIATLLVTGLGLSGGLETADAGGLEFRQAEHFLQQVDERQPRELWLMAETITVWGHMDESFFGLAGTADLNGRFAKDVWAAAKQITFDGHVDESARFAARNSVLVHGHIGSSLMGAATRTVKLEPEAIVERDALLAAHNVIVQGRIHGRAAIWAKRAIISGRVDGDLYLRADDITFLQGAHIGGDLIYTAPRDLILDQHVHVGGVVERRELPATGVGLGQDLMIQFLLFSGALFTGLIFTALFPRYTGHAVRRIRRSFWNSALIGSLAFFLIPAAAVLAVLTVIGIPAGIVLAGAYAILLYLAKIVVALALGGVVLRRRGPQPYFRVAGTLAIGLLLLYFLTGLPIVGSIGTIAILFIGLGALILGLTDVQYGPRPPPLSGAQGSPEPRTRDALSQKP